MSSNNGVVYEGNCLDSIVLEEKELVKGLTDGQIDYIDAINKSIVSLCDGLAGTGKTYIAVAKALELLLNKKVKKVIFTRPTVECGPKLGALPGDLEDKISPYMRPILDILTDLCQPNFIDRKMADGTIEFCAIAYMRGRSIPNACIVLDEAQNCTHIELKMFLSRFGENSKVIISGDTTQCDLPEKLRLNGKVPYDKILADLDKEPYLDGVEVCYLYEEDIVRHGLISKILARIK